MAGSIEGIMEGGPADGEIYGVPLNEDGSPRQQWHCMVRDPELARLFADRTDLSEVFVGAELREAVYELVGTVEQRVKRRTTRNGHLRLVSEGITRAMYQFREYR